MDSLQLRYFKVAAQTQNISKAAQMLYISQSSLSQTIQHLEKELGYALFNRVGRHIRLNANGVIFLEFVNKLEQSYSSMLTRLEELNEKYQHTVTLDIQCASLYLPQILAYLREELPEVMFRVLQRNNDSQLKVDADIRVHASSGWMEEDKKALLLEENVLLAIPREHPLAGRQDICLADLKEEEFVGLNDSWSLQKIIEEQCRAGGIQFSTSIQVDNPDILRRLLCQNLGLAFVPEKTWGVGFAKGMLELHEIADFSVKRYVYISWTAEYLPRNIEKCVTLIKNFFEKL